MVSDMKVLKGCDQEHGKDWQRAPGRLPCFAFPAVAVPFLEFPRVPFCPALDDHFLFAVKLDSVAALAVHHAEKAVFPSAEGEIGHGRGDSDVDADVAGGRLIPELARGRTARGKQ